MTDLLTATHFEGRPLGKAYKLRNGCIVRTDPGGPWAHGGVIVAVPPAQNSYTFAAGSDLCLVYGGLDPLTWTGGGFGEGFDVVGEYPLDAPEAPSTPNKPFKVGQVWKTRGGTSKYRTYTIEAVDAEGEQPIRAISSGGCISRFSPGGRFYADGSEGVLDLVELVTDAPADGKAALPAIAVGQRWSRSDGQVVTIVKDDGTGIPFRDNAGRWYRRDGSSGEVRLVELLDGPAHPIPAIAVGQLWRRSDGGRVRITDNDGTDRPWRSNDGIWYTPDGVDEDGVRLVELLQGAAATEAAPAKEVPALAVGQKWKTRGGDVVTIIPGRRNGFFRLELRPALADWWYRSHRGSKFCHSPGVLGEDHKDTLVELVEDVKQSQPEPPKQVNAERPAFAPWQVWRHRDGGLRVIASHDARSEHADYEWLLIAPDGTWKPNGYYWFSTQQLSELLVEYVGPMAMPEGAEAPEVKFSAKAGDVWADDSGKEWLVAEVGADDEDAMYLAYPRVGDADGSAGFRWFDAAGELETDGDEDSIRLRRLIRNAFTG
jgi:hypothetical protein